MATKCCTDHVPIIAVITYREKDIASDKFEVECCDL